MKRLFNFFSNDINIYGKFKVNNYECHIEDDTKRVFVLLSYKGISNPHKIYLEDLINNDQMLLKLEFQSLKYVLSIFGVISSQAKNNFFEITELLYFDGLVRVQHLETLETQIWDINHFNQHFIFLDKQSIKTASEFFSNHQPCVIDHSTL